MKLNSLKSFGFTLFEMLIAVSIFAVIGVMSMSSLIQVGETGEQVSSAQQRLSNIQFMLAYIGKDVTQLVNRKVRDQYGDEQPQLILKDNSLTFTRQGWSNLLQQPRSNLQRVEYVVQDETLVRRFWPELDQAYTERKLEQPLLSGIQDFSIKFITKGKEKLDQWPIDQPETPNTIPVALELTMELSGFGKIQRVFEVSDALL